MEKFRWWAAMFGRVKQCGSLRFRGLSQLRLSTFGPRILEVMC